MWRFNPLYKGDEEVCALQEGPLAMQHKLPWHVVHTTNNTYLPYDFLALTEEQISAMKDLPAKDKVAFVHEHLGKLQAVAGGGM